MVGASLAIALKGLDVRVALIEAVPHTAASHSSFDERTTALSNGSRRILETLGVWPEVAALATSIRKIHVSDQGHFGFARIDAAEQGLEALGAVVPNRILGSALWAQLEACDDVRRYCPARVSQVSRSEQRVLLEVTEPGGTLSTIETQLVVAADGVASAVRSAFGIVATVRDYGQTALITTILPRKFHDYVAYERFTANGPLALLPLADGRCTLVLTLSHALAQVALDWSEQEFLAEVQRRFGWRLGRFLKAGQRIPYPLSLTRARCTSAERCVIVGNAAQGLHPVAGMGFNLGLRDVASLAELIAEHRRDPRPGKDLGDSNLLSAYDAWRFADRRQVIEFTDGLVKVFSHPSGPVKGLRSLGLLTFDLLPPAKAALSRLSTGSLGRIPKLARGVALTLTQRVASRAPLPDPGP
jgi:2-octaprenyl-6-methoxyphenol hydroxylase